MPLLRINFEVDSLVTDNLKCNVIIKYQILQDKELFYGLIQTVFLNRIHVFTGYLK